MANIFTLSPLIGAEDRFTSSLHYLIEVYPDIGQTIADYILVASGKNHSKFIRSDDHPDSTLQDRPDFLIDCQDFEIICEHKIDAPLGEKQLERYLALTRKKDNYLTLITLENCNISDEVINNKKYLKPINSKYPYFSWQDIYPLIKAHPSKIAQDFAEYMTSLGMQPWNSDILSDLFESQETANLFSQSWEGIRNNFKDIGASCKLSAKKLGFEISYPLPWLHLLYFSVTKQNKYQSFKCDGPYLVANIWVKKSNKDAIKKISEDIFLEYEFGEIYGESLEKQAPWDKDLINVFQFYTPLPPLLSNNIIIMRKNLLSFSQIIFHYTQEELEAI